MNVQFEDGDAAEMRTPVMTGILLGAVVITWIIAATHVWVLAPLLAEDPAVAHSPESVPPAVLAIATAASGFVLLVGLAVNWFVPKRATGRAVLLISGLMLTISGAALANETLESGWSGLAAGLGLACGLIQVLVGLLVWIAGMSDWLTRPSLVRHVWVAEPTSPRVRAAMLPLSAAVALCWLFCAIVVVSRFDLERTGMVAWFVAVWGMPILAGMVVAGWRDTDPNKLQSLGLAALAGLTLDMLFLLVLGVGYYQFNPIGFAPWWAIMGAVLGATGFALWELVVHRGKKQLHSY
jgi:hypothetical protein